MYDKEIAELNKKITQKNNLINEINDDKKKKYKFITFLMILSTALGIGLGALLGQILIVPIMTISLGSIASIQIHEKGIKGDQNKIDTAKMRIEEYKKDIISYKNEQAKGLDYTDEVAKDEENSYSYSPEKNKSSEEFTKYVESLRDEGFFEDFDNSTKKR